MPSMLEQAIIDANALREAAMQTAESAIVEKKPLKWSSLGMTFAR